MKSMQVADRRLRTTRQRTGRFVDLALLYKLVNRVPNATTELKRIVEDHIRQMGIDAIERVSGTAINVRPADVRVLRLTHRACFD